MRLPGKRRRDLAPHARKGSAPPGDRRPPRRDDGVSPRRRFELQFHPADIRGRVRYLFLTRRHLAALAAALLAWLTLVGYAAAVAPEVIGSLLSQHRHRALLAERERQGERLEAQVARLEELTSRGDGLSLKLRKIFLAYGLDSEEAQGQGGYPLEAREPVTVPRSIYGNSVERGSRLVARLEEGSRVLGTFLDELDSFEQAHRERSRTTPSVSPLRAGDSLLTSPFGNRRSPFTKKLDFHAGIDLAAPLGTPIHAPADGVVTFAGRYPLKRSVGWWRYGNLVVLAHGDRFVTLFGHCDEISVRRGQRVRQGEVIGTVGNTGWSTSPHLHYEVRRRSAGGDPVPTDPRIYMLDHRWRDEERLLVRARSAPEVDFEPLPRLLLD